MRCNKNIFVRKRQREREKKKARKHNTLYNIYMMKTLQFNQEI